MIFSLGDYRRFSGSGKELLCDEAGELYKGMLLGIDTTTKELIFRSLSPETWLEGLKIHYGPMRRTLAALDEAERAGLTIDLMARVASLNRAQDGRWCCRASDWK